MAGGEEIPVMGRVKISHVISSEVPMQFRKLFYEFIGTEGYEIENFEISTSAVMIGANQNRANIIIITSAYIEFNCSEEKAMEFWVKQSIISKH